MNKEEGNSIIQFPENIEEYKAEKEIKEMMPDTEALVADFFSGISTPEGKRAMADLNELRALTAKSRQRRFHNLKPVKH